MRSAWERDFRWWKPRAGPPGCWTGL